MQITKRTGSPWRLLAGAMLALIATSATSKEAAMNLGISERTVEIHRAHILGKLGPKNSADLARRVINFILESGVFNADTQ